ncbi:MAG: right-handed parallel beta-helix repeat-containing protein, partial [Synergistaceae bacterium]|nr:right-handed parallel beta-helix repeat-containing protein [Synergistaceae bacterium]
MFKEKKFSILVLVCAALLVVPSVSYAKNIIVSDAQNYVRYEFDGNSNAGGAIATLRELFAQVVESGDVVYIGENWDTGDVDGNGEVDETWETTTWLARFIITEPIEISKDVAIYASCPGRRLDNETIEVQPTTEADMTDDLTTFEGKSSQIFIIRNGAKVKIANLRITGAYGGSDSSGGAIYVSEGSHAEITNCIIKDSARNNYSRGGAIYVNASTLTLKSSDIINNYSNYRGGGIAIENGSYASITNCTITSNDSPASGHGGGGIYILSSSADITDSVITKNTTSLGDGGGVCIVGSSTTGISSVTLTNCTISDNTCQYEGGGIDVFYATAAIKNCIISGNTCTGFTYSDGSHHHG